MDSWVRKFKRYYHLAKELLSKMPTANNFQLNINFENESLKASTTPEDKATVEFIVVMRRYLNSASPIYYRTVWGNILKECGQELSGEVVTRMEAVMTSIEKGALSYVENEQEITARKIYEIMEAGEYFGSDLEARDHLARMFSMPVAQSLYWWMFHSYIVNAFGILWELMNIIQELEKKNCLSQLEKAQEPQCIFCLTTDGPFTTEEHIIPEALGNDELVLAKGMVCDKCQTVLSELDQEFGNWPPMAFAKIQYGFMTKKGKLPTAIFDNTSLELTRPGHILIKDKTQSVPLVNESAQPGEQVKFTIEMKARVDAKKIVREVYKMGLEVAALALGHEVACSSRYEAARAFVLGNGPCPNDVLFLVRETPKQGIQVQFLDHETGSLVFIAIHEAVFLVNLEAHTQLKLTPEIASAGFVFLPTGVAGDWQRLYKDLLEVATIAAQEEDYKTVVQVSKIALKYAFDEGSIGEIARTRADLGNAYMALGEFDEAQAVYDDALQMNSKRTKLSPDLLQEILNNQAFAYLQTGKINLAIRNLNRSLQLASTNAATWALRGLANIYRERYDWALADCERSLELEQDNPFTLINQGLALVRLGRYEDGVSAYNRSLELNPDDPTALSNRGIAKYELGRFDQSLNDLDRSLQLRPDDPATLTSRGNTYAAMGMADEALADYQRSVELRRDDPTTLYNLGVALSNRYRHEDAINAFTQSIQLRPAYAPAYINRSLCYDELGRYDEALADLDYAISMQPSMWQAFFNRGVVLAHLGRTEDALIAGLEALALEPDEPHLIRNVALILYQLKRPNEALPYLDRLLEFQLDITRTLSLRALVYLQLANRPAALEDLKAVHEHQPYDAGILYNVACAYSQMGDRVAALTNLETAMKADEKFREQAQEDEDFAPLRDDPEFRDLVGLPPI
jgi:tetratricopeptide (TPR) repeat protein